MEKFTAQIKKLEDKNGTYVEIPFDVEKVYNAKRVKVKATFDGCEYRGSIVRMGGSCYIIGINKEIKKQIGKDFGDIISVTIEKDEDERVVEVPIELLEKINENQEVSEFWNSLSFSIKRKYVNWITGAKKEDTRLKRMNTAIEKLKNKEKI